jgi:hypothetical protein
MIVVAMLETVCLRLKQSLGFDARGNISDHQTRRRTKENG